MNHERHITEFYIVAQRHDATGTSDKNISSYELCKSTNYNYIIIVNYWYSRRQGKIAITVQFSVHRLNGVQRSPKRRSPFSSPEQTASDMIGYSLSNYWNAVFGTPTIF